MKGGHPGELGENCSWPTWMVCDHKQQLATDHNYEKENAY